MKRRTKFIVVIVAGLLLIGGIFGATAVFADNPSGDTAAADLLQKVADNYKALTGNDLDTTALQQAFDDARAQVQAEHRQAFLDKLVEDGVITREQADQYQSWLDSRPDVPQLNGPRGGFGGGFFGPRGGRMFGGFGCWTAPDQTQPSAAQSSF